MRRFTRRRKTLAAISAIMGRLGKGLQNTTRPIFQVQYRKLDDESNQQQQQEHLRFMPALPEYMSYCCCQCGHTQKLKVSSLLLAILDRKKIIVSWLLVTELRVATKQSRILSIIAKLIKRDGKLSNIKWSSPNYILHRISGYFYLQGLLYIYSPTSLETLLQHTLISFS